MELARTASPGVLRRPVALIDERLPDMEHWLAPEIATPVANVLTIDLEDWPIAVLGPRHAVTNRVVANTKRVLQILQWHGVRATFFVLTKVAERYADLIRAVHDAGHEVASHGHGHELLPTITPGQFEQDVSRSVEILTRITGRRPIGYRAPAFSVIESTRWAGPILSDLGFTYSSSVFPIKHPRYGIPNAPAYIHRWPECSLIECPPATLHRFNRNWPVAGGGYMRLLPGALVRYAIRRINAECRPAVLYMHPYELDVGGVVAHKRDGLRVGPRRHLTQSLFRSRIEHRLHRLLESFRFVPMCELLNPSSQAASELPAAPR